jgi:hypothetical protein
MGNYAYLNIFDYGLNIFNLNNTAYPNQVGSHNCGMNSFSMCVGHDYAFIATETAGVEIISIANPANPQFISRIACDGICYFLKANDNYLYRAIDRGDFSDLEVIDVSDVYNPVIIALLSFANHINNIEFQGNYVYLTAYSFVNLSNFMIFDVSSPESPNLIGQYNMLYPGARLLELNGNYAYVGFHESIPFLVEIPFIW